MKKFSSVLAILMMVFIGGLASAQTVASMNYASVLEAMPETKKMTADIEAWSKVKGQDIQRQVASFQEEVTKYQSAAAGLTEDQRKAKEADLQKKQQNLQQLEQAAQQELGKKRNDMLTPILKKLNDSVAKVAKANNVTMVVDGEAVIYNGGVDLTPMVRKDLGI